MKSITVLLLVFSMLFIQCQNNTEQTTTAQNSPTMTTETRKNIIFFGNSLTAGFGLDDVSKGFVQLIQARIDSLSLPYRCINAGLSGETTAGGKERVDWVIGQQPVDIFILELGGNDALRGIQPQDGSQNLQAIIDKVKAKNPSVKIILAGMEAPRNMGTTYTKAFREIYPTLAKKNNTVLIPFVLEGVGGVAELNQKDGIHPTEAGNAIIAETIWRTLKPIL